MAEEEKNLKTTSKKYFYFDLDDTLLRTAEASRLGLEKAYNKLASECSDDISSVLPMAAFISKMEGLYSTKNHSEFEINDFEDFCKDIPSTFPISPSHTGDSLAARLYWYYKETKNKALMPYEGVFNLLSQLKKQGSLVYCITRGLCNYQFTKLMLSDLEDRFQAVIVVDSTKSVDSKAKQLENHLSKNNIDRSRAVIVGDSPEDIDAGHAAGIGTIRIRSKRHEKEEPKKPAGKECASVLDLKRALGSHEHV